MISSSIPAFPVTLLHPGTRPCRNFILALIFSLLTCILAYDRIWFSIWRCITPAQSYLGDIQTHSFGQAVAIGGLTTTGSDVDIISLLDLWSFWFVLRSACGCVFLVAAAVFGVLLVPTIVAMALLCDLRTDLIGASFDLLVPRLLLRTLITTWANKTEIGNPFTISPFDGWECSIFALLPPSKAELYKDEEKQSKLPLCSALSQASFSWSYPFPLVHRCFPLPAPASRLSLPPQRRKGS